MAQFFCGGLALLTAGCISLAPSAAPELTPAEAFAALPTPEFVARATKVYPLAEGQCAEDATPERAAEAVRHHWGTPDGEMVAMICRRIWRGMTARQLRFSWGEPSTINRSVGSWGTHEQWVYRDYYGYNPQYVYVENGKVESFQTSGEK